ncbi:MAG: hypothetical protein KatS3mg082_0183 [Nitrospiraceae bacterium]|nr:MAG: hypothetical protein KatS3mg082_0183 [Nitrospiraceae bacterium]
MRGDTVRPTRFPLAASAGFIPLPAWAADWMSSADAFSAFVAGLVFVVFCLSAAYSLWQEKRRASLSKSIRYRLRKAA